MLGGVCLHTGTIPSKTIREAILHLTGYRQRDVYDELYRRKREITMDELRRQMVQVSQNEWHVIQDQFARNRIYIIPGEASFVDPHTVEVATGGERQHLSATNILIATGTKPSRPDQKLDPSRSAFLCAEFRPSQQVALGKDADQRTRAVDDRKAADAALQHQLNGMHDGRVGVDGDRRLRHDIASVHVVSPRQQMDVTQSGVQFVEARSPENFDGAFSDMAKARADALIVLGSTTKGFRQGQTQFLGMAERRQINQEKDSRNFAIHISRPLLDSDAKLE
jgi:hypothetical protein